MAPYQSVASGTRLVQCIYWKVTWRKCAIDWAALARLCSFRSFRAVVLPSYDDISLCIGAFICIIGVYPALGLTSVFCQPTQCIIRGPISLQVRHFPPNSPTSLFCMLHVLACAGYQSPCTYIFFILRIRSLQLEYLAKRRAPPSSTCQCL